MFLSAFFAELGEAETLLTWKKEEEGGSLAVGKAALERARLQVFVDPAPITASTLVGHFFRRVPRPVALIADLGGAVAAVIGLAKPAGAW